MKIGTRGSALALWQARHVADRLRAAGHAAEIVTFTTKGDRILDVPLAEIGDKGLFTAELDRALLAGAIHLAVHSLKDLPTTLPEGLVLAATTERASPWDAFVAHPDVRGSLDGLPEGATLATSSLRRQAQLLAWRPDLRVVPVRGNVPTRLAKLDASGPPKSGGWHGVILAAAGLERLGLEDRIRERIDPAVMLPAVGQGALGIVCAEGDTETARTLASALDHPDTAAAATAERAFLRRLEGGCQVPVAAWARLEAGTLMLDGAVASLDGAAHLRDAASGTSAEAGALGTALAERMLDAGAGAILGAIRETSKAQTGRDA
ncbi:MAG: hydroxymethylbilane synthase [Bacteroidota bacterium]